MDIKRNKPNAERSSKITKRGGKIKRGFVSPDFDSLFEPDDENPLDGLAYENNVEADSQQEMSAALQHVIAHKKAMREQWRVTVDTEFWFAVCFQSREQKEEFLQKAGLLDLGDKYLDGLRLAEKLGINIEPILLQSRAVDKPPRGLRDRKFFL